MQDIDWNEFKRKNKNPQKAFEDLCYFLFCREHKQSNGIFGYKNQVGIEKEPLNVDGKYVGFQAKFADHTVPWQLIRLSIARETKKSEVKRDLHLS